MYVDIVQLHRNTLTTGSTVTLFQLLMTYCLDKNVCITRIKLKQSCHIYYLHMSLFARLLSLHTCKLARTTIYVIETVYISDCFMQML